MSTVLLYLVITVLVGGVLFVLASVVFGRAEEMAPLPTGTTATALPAEGVSGSDVRALRFQQATRGYKASEVDWALDRLALEIDQLRDLVNTLSDRAPSDRAHSDHIKPDYIGPDRIGPDRIDTGPTATDSGEATPVSTEPDGK